MATVFISNHPQGRQAKFKVNGQLVGFVNGVFTSSDDALTEALKSRDIFPIYGVHFHLKDLDAPVPQPDEEESAVRQGSRGTTSFSRAARRSSQ